MEIIDNSLPSAPPIFLRSGKLILLNRPATRSADLDNKYSLIAALGEENPRATGVFLGANNFSDNGQIDQCVEKGCSLEFSVYKGVDYNFILEWRYKGKANLEVNMEVHDIRVVDE